MASSSDSKYSRRYSSEELEKPILELLDSNPHGLNINQIAQQLEINRNTISKWLKTLEAKNKIISRKTGVSNLYYKSKQQTGIFPGPYVLTVEVINGKFIIKQSNNMYINRINEINESLIGADLFNFFPFSEYASDFEEFLNEAIKHVDGTDDIFSEKIEVRNQDNVTETFSFKISNFPKKPQQYIIEFQDLSLVKIYEDQLVNPDSFGKLLNLFTDAYVSIQSQDFKVIMANKNVINDFNNGITIRSEPIYCYDLYRNKSSPCEDCVCSKALETGKKQKIRFDLKGKPYDVETIPIQSSEVDLKGFIFIAKEYFEKKR